MNGLKTVNDTQGHEAGDELIRGAARCILSVIREEQGRCFRTGGDEFVVLACMTLKEAEEAAERLERTASAWHGEKVRSLHMAVGLAHASEHPGLTAEKLVGIADQEMYKAKSAYYRTAGIDRRRSGR